ncbi:unnamed protein product, partial [Medioppia subpectinata]
CGDIGDFTTENISSFEYCVRLVCNQFLLNGSSGRLISDKRVRVSIKSLALGCVAAVVRLHPKTLIIELFLECDKTLQKSDSSQKIWDILLYSTHTDPQIRGQIAIIIGHFIDEVLKESQTFNELKDNPYWLIKTALVDLKNGIIVKKESLQKRILNEVFFPFLADEDFRVREATAHSLCNLIPVLFTPAIHLDNDPITAIAFEHTIKNLLQKDLTFKDFEANIPPIKAFIDPLNSQHLILSAKNRLIEANLSDIIINLLNSLQFNLDNKHALIGYCNALAFLSNKYPITEYPDCWGSDLSETSVSMQLLDICMTLLSTSSLVVLDLTAHQSVLSLTGNLCEGLAYNAIKTNFKNSVAFAPDLDWGLLSHVSPHLVQQLEAIFTHLMRIMNIYSSIIDEPLLTSTNIMSTLTNYNKMPVIQTLSNSPLSPIRRKSLLKTSDLSDKMDSMKRSDSEKSDKDKFTKYGSNTLLVRLSEMIRASYLSNKTSMDLSGDK